LLRRQLGKRNETEERWLPEEAEKKVTADGRENELEEDARHLIRMSKTRLGNPSASIRLLQSDDVSILKRPRSLSSSFNSCRSVKRSQLLYPISMH